LKQELSAANSFMQEAGSAVQAEPTTTGVESEESEDDDCDDELPESFRKPEAQMGRARQSVSAEAYGQWNQKKAFTAPVYDKTEEMKSRLKECLSKAFLFQGLEEGDMNTVLMAMQEAKFASGEKVITEGDDGDMLFVIEKGAFECKKTIDGEEKVVKTCEVGDLFGELALLYNCPRAASVFAKDECVTWKLDRETFNHIVKDAAMKRRNKYETFLGSVSLLECLGQYEKSQMADALKQESFGQGQEIVRQGDPGDNFYIVEEGALFAEKRDPDGNVRRVLDYKPGDYFGELALLKNQPRAATIKVESATGAKVLSLGRQSFNKMLGPLQDLLKEKGAAYVP